MKETIKIQYYTLSIQKTYWELKKTWQKDELARFQGDKGHGATSDDGMLCQDDVAPGEFLLLQCACQFPLDWAHQLMHVHNQFLIVISSSGMLAMLGMGAGPLKLW